MMNMKRLPRLVAVLMHRLEEMLMVLLGWSLRLVGTTALFRAPHQQHNHINLTAMAIVPGMSMMLLGWSLRLVGNTAMFLAPHQQHNQVHLQEMTIVPMMIMPPSRMTMMCARLLMAYPTTSPSSSELSAWCGRAS
jgi:hypothetical protein